jgi:hypothetical protein
VTDDQQNTTNDERDLQNPQERQARTMQAMKDFFAGAGRKGKPGRARNVQPGTGLFTNANQNTGTEE